MNQELDLAELPTYAHLNRAQKRAFILRDKLKFLEATHLDTFIAGIEPVEPPNYRNINGKIVPPYTEVTLKKEAKRLDLGNVRFHERDRSFIKRAHLVIDGGNCELKETKPLPHDDENLLSVPIEAYSVESTVPLFLAKYEAIETRRHHINKVRRAAFSGAKQYEVQVNKGKSLSRLHSESFEADGTVYKPRPRAPGDPIPRHVSNKRQRVGLASVPDSIKMEALSQVPGHLKVNLFDIIIKNAFPHFDNLMMAAWNVVSLFGGTGTEENDLLRAVSQLDTVLREFDDYYAQPKKPKNDDLQEEDAEIRDHETLARPSNQYQSRSGSSRMSTPVVSTEGLTTPHHPIPPNNKPLASTSSYTKQEHLFRRPQGQISTENDDDDEEEDPAQGMPPPTNPLRSNRQPSVYPPTSHHPHLSRQEDEGHYPYARKAPSRAPSLAPTTSYLSHAPHPHQAYHPPPHPHYANYPQSPLNPHPYHIPLSQSPFATPYPPPPMDGRPTQGKFSMNPPSDYRPSPTMTSAHVPPRPRSSASLASQTSSQQHQQKKPRRMYMDGNDDVSRDVDSLFEEATFSPASVRGGGGYQGSLRRNEVADDNGDNDENGGDEEQEEEPRGRSRTRAPLPSKKNPNTANDTDVDVEHLYDRPSTTQQPSPNPTTLTDTMEMDIDTEDNNSLFIPEQHQNPANTVNSSNKNNTNSAPEASANPTERPVKTPAQGLSLGRSALGARKNTKTDTEAAPVANMFGAKKSGSSLAGPSSGATGGGAAAAGKEDEQEHGR